MRLVKRHLFLFFLELAGKEQWSVEEDKILLSKNKEAISCVAKTKGLQSVVDRMNFMEGIN